MEARYCFAGILCAGCLLLLALLEAGAGHLRRDPGTARRSQPRAMAVAAVGDSGHRVGSERSGPKGLGLGKCWHVTV